MSEDHLPGVRSWKSLSRQLLLTLVGVVVLGGTFWYGTWSVRHVPSDTTTWPTQLMSLPPYMAPLPVLADDPRISPRSIVLGVTIGGRHRAYALHSMSNNVTHIVNDKLGDLPLTVAYCDRTHCYRAFTTSNRKTPLELSVGGWLNKDGIPDMLVLDVTHRYKLKSGESLDPNLPPIPYDSVTVEKMSWEDWQNAHPDTDLVIPDYHDVMRK